MAKLYPLPYIKFKSLRGKTLHKTRNLHRLPPEKVVVMGASAGGLDALCTVMRTLPDGLPLTVLVLQHLREGHNTHLADILGRSTRLAVREAEPGVLLEKGVVYVAVPGKHLLVRDRRIVLGNGLPVRHVKPSVDVLFKSVAAIWGPAVMGIILSGTGSDGAAGCRAVKAAGGVIMAQDPGEAAFSGMPEAAVKTGCVDHVLPAGEIGEKIAALTVQ